MNDVNKFSISYILVGAIFTLFINDILLFLVMMSASFIGVVLIQWVYHIDKKQKENEVKNIVIKGGMKIGLFEMVVQ